MLRLKEDKYSTFFTKPRILSFTCLTHVFYPSLTKESILSE